MRTCLLFLLNYSSLSIREFIYFVFIYSMLYLPSHWYDVNIHSRFLWTPFVCAHPPTHDGVSHASRGFIRYGYRTPLAAATEYLAS